MTSLGKRSLMERELIEAHYLCSRQSLKRNSTRASSSARPTHFLALPVNEFQPLHSFVSEVQKSLLLHSPQLKDTLVESQAAHITLGVLTLRSEEESNSLCSVLSEWFAKNAVGPIQLNLCNLRQFKSGVLYIEAKNKDSQMFELQSSITKLLAKEGFLDNAKSSFNPHVTVAKFSKLKRGRKGRGTVKLKKFAVESYKEHMEYNVGCVNVRSLQVCSMVGRKKGEYYNVIQSFNL